MYTIKYKKILNPTVTMMKIEAPYIAKKAKAGQFVILRVNEQGERVPMTIAEADVQSGTITIIFQVVGATTKLLNELEVGNKLQDFVGPLGKASEITGLKKVAVVGGGVGCAIAYPTAKALFDQGSIVHSIIGFRNKDLVILEDEFRNVSHEVFIKTDDGSYGTKGLVTDQLKELFDQGIRYDEIFVIGPLIMMKYVSLLTKQYNIKTTVSMNPIMIDGTGMCGGCRITVGKGVKFACVDGPDFDGHLVDFDEAIRRNQMYQEFEHHKYEETCNLLKGVKENA